ncbi:MAG: type I 3-dehydroquinate dehydratase [Thaumarchaeota archaeon]|nr:type I 3-dehydroquinate dehydratase [Nitrososphaerota archaeon]MCL5318729.1 type I 3-dehydroquinate dehydratase [Nitrososphaerota archaeon]
MAGYGGLPKICTAIPASSIAALQTNLEKAFKYGSDYAEIRFDYLNNINFKKITPPLKPYAARCVYTCRRYSEGGHFNGKEDARRNILKRLAEQHPAYVDVELSTVREAPNLVNSLRSSGTKIIVSWHNFDETPSQDVLRKAYSDAASFGDVAKIITFAHRFRDNSSVLSLYNSAEKGRLIAFCMGESGILSRVLCPLLGSPFTYASLEDEKTAPGQIPLKELKEFYATI